MLKLIHYLLFVVCLPLFTTNWVAYILSHDISDKQSNALFLSDHHVCAAYPHIYPDNIDYCNCQLLTFKKHFIFEFIFV